jgi:hypothetical protein
MTLVSAHLGFNRTNALVDGGTLLMGDDPTYYYRVFTGNGNLTVSNLPVAMDIVLVGGGGGGGAVSYINFGGGGGGGGGGVREQMGLTVNPGSYAINIGAGGVGGNASSVVPTNGGDTSISGLGISSISGGGRGASRTPAGFFNPLSGGSGGGGSTYINSGQGAGGGADGFTNGGNHANGVSGGGGGGGAGAAGAAASNNNGQGANGGAGRASLYVRSIPNTFAVPVGSGGGGGNTESTNYGVTTAPVYTISSIAKVDGVTTCYTTNTPSVRAWVSIERQIGDVANVFDSVLSVNPGVSFTILTDIPDTSGPITYRRSSAGGSGLFFGSSGQGAFRTTTAVGVTFGYSGAQYTGGGGGGGYSDNTFVTGGGAGAGGQVLVRYTRASVGG